MLWKLKILGIVGALLPRYTILKSITLDKANVEEKINFYPFVSHIFCFA